MPLKKNDEILLQITAMTLQGSGIGSHEGLTVFVPAAATGDTVLAQILKVKPRYAYARLLRVHQAAGQRIEADCPVFPQCGGCAFRHITYEAELALKQQAVHDAFMRIGKLSPAILPIRGAAQQAHYRNKAQLPLAQGADGSLQIGFYAPRSHRVVDCRRCRLQPQSMYPVIEAIAQWIQQNSISIYREATQTGVLRHIYMRTANNHRDVMVCLVGNANTLPHAHALLAALSVLPQVKSIWYNVNRQDTNVILGERSVLLWGEPLTDTLCGLAFRLSPAAFYQVNRDQAQVLYGIAAEFAGLDGSQRVLDLYCGTGTIGLCLAKNAKQVLGIESIAQAVEDARHNAAANNIANANFVCCDAAQTQQVLHERAFKPDVAVIDPPRKGCTADVLETLCRLQVEKIVYVSCDPATLARDCARLAAGGYRIERVQPVDMFPRTGHVETIVLLQRQNT